LILPMIGTPEYDTFMRKAQDPRSIEASIVAQLAVDATMQAQAHVRQMLFTMIEAVPGQLFRDIVRFHGKFGLPPQADEDHVMARDVTKFRLKFLLEELLEYADAVDFKLKYAEDGFDFSSANGDSGINAEKAFDGLIDLVYVALGTAFLHRFPFNEGWSRVQEANMAKERATSADDARSTRKHKTDIVKPAGWKPPVLVDLLHREVNPCVCPGNPPKIDVGDKEYCEMCSGIARGRS